MQELLKELGIDKIGEYSEDNSYVININDSNEFGRIFSKLDRNDRLEELEDSTILTPFDTSMIWLYNNYQINLLGDLAQDLYQLVITEIK